MLPQLPPIIGHDMKAVDATIRKNLHSEIELIQEISKHIILSGGKRIRPILLLLCARASCPDTQPPSSDERLHTLAAVIEFIHTATLLHDDVVDNSTLRRGKATANIAYGNSASILVGDFLYSRAFQMIAQLNAAEITKVLASTTNLIAEGEVLQLNFCRNSLLDEATYFQILHQKTAVLFKAAAQIGALHTQAIPSVVEHLGQYGEHIGIAFQLIDDALDYSGDSKTIGKNIGDDLQEGKLTLPLLRALEIGTPQHSTAIQTALHASFQPTLDESQATLQCITDALQQTDALVYTLSFAQQHTQKAQTALDNLAPSPFKTTLLEVADVLIQRTR